MTLRNASNNNRVSVGYSTLVSTTKESQPPLSFSSGGCSTLNRAFSSGAFFPRVNFPVIAYEFAADRNFSESLAASVGNQKRFHW